MKLTIEEANTVVVVEAVANMPRTWGGDSILLIEGVWFAPDYRGRLKKYEGPVPVENFKAGPFPAGKFGASPEAGERWLRDRDRG